tara:strand:+ start:413 stop:514 length:102 start_codon:yes stop_codon:yes gene_type:complete
VQPTTVNVGKKVAEWIRDQKENVQLAKAETVIK